MLIAHRIALESGGPPRVETHAAALRDQRR